MLGWTGATSNRLSKSDRCGSWPTYLRRCESPEELATCPMLFFCSLPLLRVEMGHAGFAAGSEIADFGMKPSVGIGLTTHKIDLRLR